MKVIVASCPDEALYLALSDLGNKDYDGAVSVDSRNGETIEYRSSLLTVWKSPRRRVLFSPVRDANPFLHLFEAMWMLEGRRDVGFFDEITRNMRQFSDDGVILNGAYGFRWRTHFGKDQLQILQDMLKGDPTTRRAVLTMWDPGADLPPWSKDHPCNTHAYFRVTDGELRMTVCARSNDLVWGAYGANVVHFSFLQEFLAGALGMRVGLYEHLSNSAHIYTNFPVVRRCLSDIPGLYSTDRYKYDVRVSPPLCDLEDGEEVWMTMGDITRAVQVIASGELDQDVQYLTRFSKHVLGPMIRAHSYVRERNFSSAADYLSEQFPYDWIVAGREWCERRATDARR